MEDAQRLWMSCSASLRAQVSEATWRAWFDAVAPVAVDEGALVLAVPSSLAKERIEGRYLNLVRTAVRGTTGTDLPVRLLVRTEASAEASAEATPGPTGSIDPPATSPDQASVLTGTPWDASTGRRDPGAGPSGRSAPPRWSQSPARPPAPREEAPLNPQYTFDAFVMGASNRFAHAAALSVAEKPALSYNPLFVHGGAGLGKTHLLHAIGNYVRENYPTRHVRYVSTETFLNDFVDAIRTSTTAAFKRRYRECDVLLVDDVQFMENKEGLQEEFFHTFNSLYEAAKQIVITSDRPAKSIATLEDRLRSRFLWGLTTDVQPPDFETRLAILRKKADGETPPVPEEVLEFIATHVKDNIRELEGALTRVTAFANLSHQPLDRRLAEQVLADIVSGDQPRRITAQGILDATADTFGFSVEELCGTSRRRPLVTARQIGMYVFRELTDFSYPAIAREFGGRDHTTVIHAVDKIGGLMRERRQIYDQVTELILHIKGGT
ncbi:MAG: chromosomal replication initiator protein DnaA [Acidimicrobiales bacterium]